MALYGYWFWIANVWRTSRSSILPAIAIGGFACIAIGFGFAIVPNLYPSLQGRFGDGDGRYGPLDSASAISVADHERVLGHEAGVVCEQNIRVGPGEFNTTLRSVEPDTIVLASLTRPPALNAAVASVLISERLSELIDIHPGEHMLVNGESRLVAGITSDPDDLTLPIVFETLTAANDGVCYVVLRSKPQEHELWPLLSDGQAAFWWPRTNESYAVLYELLFGLLATVCSLCAATLMASSFSMLASTLRTQASTLIAIGASPTLLKRTCLGALALLGAMIGIAGGGIGVGTASLAGHHVAELMGHAYKPVHILDVRLLGLLALASAFIVSASGWIPLRHSISQNLASSMRFAPSATPTRRLRRWLPVTSLVAGLCIIVSSEIVDSGRQLIGILLVFVGAILSGPLALDGLARLAIRDSRHGFLLATELHRHRLRTLPGLLMSGVAVAGALTAASSVTLIKISTRTSPAVGQNHAVLTAQDNWGLGLTGDPSWPTRSLSAVQVSGLTDLVGVSTSLVPIQAVIDDRVPLGELAQTRWVGTLELVGGSGMDSVFAGTTVAVYIATPELENALGLSLPSDTTSTIEVYTGWISNKNRLQTAGASLTPAEHLDYRAVRTNSLRTLVSPSALVSERDAATIGSAMTVGLLVTSVESLPDSTIEDLKRYAATNGLILTVPARPHTLNAFARLSALLGAGFVGLIVVFQAKAMASAMGVTLNRLHQLGVTYGDRRLIRIKLGGYLMAGSVVLALPIGVLPLVIAPSGMLPSDVYLGVQSLVICVLVGFVGLVAACSFGE